MASNSFLLGGVDFTDITLARVDEREAIATYPALIEEVRTRCGPDIAALFAEPVVSINRATGARNVAWFCGIEGTPFALRQLEGGARQQVSELLRQRLRAFSSLLADSRPGAVLASWLHVLSEESIVSVAGQPVIKNWGMLPASIAASAEARDAHFRNGLGQYLPSVPTPPFTVLEAQGFGAGMAQLAEREIARAAPPLKPPAAAAPAPSGLQPPRRWRRRRSPRTARGFCLVRGMAQSTSRKLDSQEATSGALHFSLRFDLTRGTRVLSECSRLEGRGKRKKPCD